MGTNDDDFVEHLLTTSTHDHILFLQTRVKYTVRKDMKFQSIVVLQKDYQLLTY